MLADYTWQFTTGSTPDTTAPTVVSTTPTNGATGVATETAISVVFSEDMNPLTITSSTFTLVSSTGAVSGTVSYDTSAKTATFSPPANLNYNTSYTAYLYKEIKDLSGNSLMTVWNELGIAYSWGFKTKLTWTQVTTAAAFTGREHEEELS